MKLHAAFTVCLLIFYVSVGIFGGLSMLGNDMKQKYAWAATTLGVFVDGMPVQPVLSATATCVSNVSTVNLSWAQSEGATAYYIKRNGTLLVSGLQTMSYVDSTVVGGFDYSYVVTAFGFSGSVESDPLTINARDCGGVQLPDPTLTLASLDGKEILQGIVPSTTKNTFKITGTTNITNANIQITTMPDSVFISTLEANQNGYWEYNLAGQLILGSYSFQIIATDPEIPSRNIIKNYPFNIVAQPVPVPASSTEKSSGKRSDGNTGSNESPTNPASNIIPNNTSPQIVENTPPVGSASVPVENQSQIPVLPPQDLGNITVNIKNKNGEVYKTQDIQAEIVFSNIGNLLKGTVDNVLNLRYEIINEKGTVVLTENVSEKIFGNLIEKSIHLPPELLRGNYTIRVSLIKLNKILSADNLFILSDMPIINFGGGMKYTYSQLLSELGWLLLITILLLLFYIFMFILEYYYYEQALFTVAEDNLIKRGLISRRKGVPR